MFEPEPNPITKAHAVAVAKAVAELWRADPPPPPHLATRKEVADRWHVNEATVKRMVNAGQLTEVLFSPKWRHFLWDDVFACEKKHRNIIEAAK